MRLACRCHAPCLDRAACLLARLRPVREARAGQDEFASYLRQVEAQARRCSRTGAPSSQGVTAADGGRAAGGSHAPAGAVGEDGGHGEDEPGARTV